jgi:hypothetical protein
LSKKKITEKTPREMTRRQLSRHQKAQRRQRIIFFGGIGVIVAVILIIAGGWFAGEYIPLHSTVLQVYDKTFDTQFFIDTLVVYGRSQGVTQLSSMASNILDQIKQNEIIRVAAEKLGYTVSDNEAIQEILSTGWPINDAIIELARGSILTSKMKDNYIGPQVPTKGVQLLVYAMMVESESVAQMVKQQIISGANFTDLVNQYALDQASQEISGNYGWHPVSIFKTKISATVPYGYISGNDTKAGDISANLSDNSSYKKLGYWLIRVNSTSGNITAGGTANVSALLLTSEEQALEVRARLMAGEALGPIADNLSQFNLSAAGHGELGIIPASDTTSAVFDGYVFNQDTPLGEWSQPLKDDQVYSRGGVWVIWIQDKADDMPLSTDDLSSLISDKDTEWIAQINNDAKDYVTSKITQSLLDFAVEKATNILASETLQT